MFNKGDLIIYSEHGICEIDDICEKTFRGVTRTYYVLHPLSDLKLTINAPVENDKVVMLRMMNSEEAEEVIQSFKQPGIEWIEDVRQRNKKYHSLVNSGDRVEISKIANTLMRKEYEGKLNNKKLYEQDRKLLTTIQNILFKELATTLNTSFEEISERVSNMIK